MRILAIETSCDDTGVAVLEADEQGNCRLLSSIVSSQIKIHAPYGGVVPNLAQRAHQENLVPVLEMAMRDTNLRIHANDTNYKAEKIKEILNREPVLLEKTLNFLNKYAKPDIDLIAVTYGPGLAPCLWVGVNFAKALAYAWDLPVVSVNHIEAHIAANWLKPEGNFQFSIFHKDLPKGDNFQTNSKFKIKNSKKEPSPQPSPSSSERELLELPSPYLIGRGGGEGSIICLVVSGGHTQLILMKKFGKYEIIGETKDDAAGEAFDKVAKLLGLGYPGGPAISREAEKWKFQISNSKFQINSKLQMLSSRIQKQNSKQEAGEKLSAIKFPRPMINTKDFDFSFSGLKTAVLYEIKGKPQKDALFTPSPSDRRERAGVREENKYISAICFEFQQAVVDVLVKKTMSVAEKYGAKTVMLSGGVSANELLRSTLLNESQKLGLEFVAPAKQFCADNAGMVAMAGWWHRDKIVAPDDLRAEANLRINYSKS